VASRWIFHDKLAALHTQMLTCTKPDASTTLRFIRRLICGMIGAAALAAMPAFGDGQRALGANDRLIHDAARMGTANDVKTILKTASGERDARNVQGSQPIHFAAVNSDSGPLKALIAAGANPNAKDVDGVTPLQMAAFARNAENTLVLLKAGADPKAKDNAGRDVLAIAHEVIANDVAGVVSLWILKGCQSKNPC
jgi:uncharacterized protein